MQKKKFISSLLILLAAILFIITFNRKRITFAAPLTDTVPAEVFSPTKKKDAVKIDLKTITAVTFPKYKLTKQTVFIPDSISIAADEENMANGNYIAILTLDTLPDKSFIQTLKAASVKDTCWKINDTYISYTRKEKNGGKYNISFSTKGKQIVLTYSHP